MMSLEDLRHWQGLIEEHARSFGLDFFETRFELLDYRQLNEVASYGGFPVRYPHWSHGMEFDRLSKGYQYGLQKIYELVINNDPCYAYLMKENMPVDQKLVMCHVYGHCDFFKNNQWFAHTNRHMVDEMANHASRIRKYVARHGVDEVEDFLDLCLSIDRLIDVHGQGLPRPRPLPEDLAAAHYEAPPNFRYAAKGYMDAFVNPEEKLRRQEKAFREQRESTEGRFPAQPERDVLLFLLEHAPLTPWQRDILGMVREEAYYFAPQWQTKIMNEGWASYWHSRLMTERVMNDSEVLDFADHHSGTVAEHSSLNPYRLGLYLLRDIEARWDTGRHGPDYDACTDLVQKREWDTGEGRGQEKLFELRRVHNDVTFVDTFLTEEFAIEHRMFLYKYDLESEQYVVASRKFAEIKQQLLAQLTNGGQPLIRLVDADGDRRGELQLVHSYEGIPLDLARAQATLVNLERIWKRPVAIESVYQGKPIRLRSEGGEVSMQEREGATGG